jgi:hypothetical protein
MDPVFASAAPDANIALQAQQATAINNVTTTDVGSIITDPKARRITWVIFGTAGIITGSIATGFMAVEQPFPIWLKIAIAVSGYLAPMFSGLAIANIPGKTK